MDSQPLTSRVDEVLGRALMRHRGYALEQSRQVQGVWSGRVKRISDSDPTRVDELEIALRDALYADHLELRSARVQRDSIELQVTIPQ
jgi:hypothetical protein